MKYHERFAADLAAELPEGFTVYADAHIVTASYGTARLVGYTAKPTDKRRPVDRADVLDWIERARNQMRRDMYHYKPEHKDAGQALLDALMSPREAA